MPHRRGFAMRRAQLAAAALALTLLAGCATTGEGYPDPSASSAARNSAEVHLQLAASYFENGQYQVALSEVQIALASDAFYADAHDLGGMIHMALNDHERAKTHFQRAMALKKDNASAMHNLAWLQCQERQYAAADALFAQALDIASVNRPKTLLARGVCQARAGQREEAQATLMQAYERDAANPVIAYNLALLLLQAGNADQARFYIRRLNNSELANAESLWLGIRIERALGNRQAMEELAAQLRRRFADSRELVAWEQGRFDE